MKNIKMNLRKCPVCNGTNVSPDKDYPRTMDACNRCGSGWIKQDKEIILDARDDLSQEEIKNRGWNLTQSII